MDKKFLLLLLLLVPLFAVGQTDSIVLNEIAWMGSSVQRVDPKHHWRYEWIELHSSAVHTVVLNGWSIELYKEGKLYFTIPLSGRIDPEGYFLIGASGNIENVDVNYENLGGKLVNSGMSIVLKNNGGTIIDTVDATTGWPGGDNATKQTMERLQGRNPCIQGFLPCIEWQTSENSGGTPKAPNIHSLSRSSSTGYADPRFGEDRSFGAAHGENPFFTVALPASLLAGIVSVGARRFLERRRLESVWRSRASDSSDVPGD